MFRGGKISRMTYIHFRMLEEKFRGAESIRLNNASNFIAIRENAKLFLRGIFPVYGNTSLVN